MFDLQKMDEEFEYVNNRRISNFEELEQFKLRYFDKDGVLPKIYQSISQETVEKSNQYLNKMISLRQLIDNRIREFTQSH